MKNALLKMLRDMKDFSWRRVVAANRLPVRYPKIMRIIPFCIPCLFAVITVAQTKPMIPRLQKTNTSTQLYVDAKPFLILGGELGNSTASDLNILDAALAKCQRMHLNTIMLPVYWDRIEPTEGNFDFSLVQGAIDRARSHQLHLVYLWFGTWKNSMSCYAPSWIKHDLARFERVKLSTGELQEIISPESTAANQADARAFAALMHWTKHYDADQHTVLMMQVENEIGMIPEPRDHSEKSDAHYNGPVPQQLLAQLTQKKLGPEIQSLWQSAGQKQQGTWSEVFGNNPAAEEIFSAWQFGKYVEKVAAAGKREYPLPMFVNAALMRPGYKAGQYPSAGPLPHLFELWHIAAPSLDMFSPDIYFPNFMEWSRRYTRNANPLFIPEMAPSARAAGNIVYAIAHYNAIGCGPFAIENVDEAKEINLRNCYEQLSDMSQLILQAQQDQKILGLSPQINFDWTLDSQPQRGQLGGIIFEAHFDTPADSPQTAATTLPTLGSGRWDVPPNIPRGSALIIQTAPEEFLIFGNGVIISFTPADKHGKIGIDWAREGHFDPQGTWLPQRWLNGDETHQGRHIHLYEGQWTIQRVKLYRY